MAEVYNLTSLLLSTSGGTAGWQEGKKHQNRYTVLALWHPFLSKYFQ
jgi:hypothetical protein